MSVVSSHGTSPRRYSFLMWLVGCNTDVFDGQAFDHFVHVFGLGVSNVEGGDRLNITTDIIK